jgi:glucose/arabinose dehydrogenase
VESFKSGGQHFGSRLLWLPDGTLLVSIGDGGNPPLRFEGELQREQAQNQETLFGGIVRVNADGSIPRDNPFVGSPEARDEFFTVGNRNIQGLAYNETSGRIWASEHGSRGGDELNHLQAGENYGWPLVSHSREYVSFTPVAEYQSLEGYEDPAMVWMETVAPSGLAVHDGRLYAGGLVSQAVHEILLNAEGNFESQRIIPIGARVRDVRVGPDGALYVLTDQAENGRLIRLALPEGQDE